MTLLAQTPRLAPYIEAMRENIAADLQLGIDAVSVKATTTEHLGFTGRKEGIAAMAVVLIERQHAA
jgi:2-C-methyl-D-erythritol 2,4-cyclodiphosphate synthase